MQSSIWQQTNLDLQNFSPVLNDEHLFNYPFSTDNSNIFMMEGEENNELTKPLKKYKSTISESSNMRKNLFIGPDSNLDKLYVIRKSSSS